MGTGAQLPIGGGSGTPEKFRSTEIDPNGVDYFVDDVNGLDSNDGLTPFTTFKTMGKAHAETVLSGATKSIYVFEGTYNENLTLSSLDFTEAHKFEWYFERGVNYNTNVSLISSPAAHIFDSPWLTIAGNGRIRYTGNGQMIDTSDAFFSLIIIECNWLTYLATGLATKPIILGDVSDVTFDITIKDTNHENNDIGVFGWFSTLNVAVGDYFIHSENPQFSKSFDVLNIRGGITQIFSGSLFLCNDASIPQIFMNFDSEGRQNPNIAEGIRSLSAQFDFGCGQKGGWLGFISVKALGTSTSNQLRIINQQELPSGQNWQSALECNQGFIQLVNCVLNTSYARSIKATGANSRLNIRDCVISMANPAIDCSDNAGTTINIYDSTIGTFGFGSSCMLVESPDTLIVNSKFKAGLGGKTITSVGAPAIQFSNSISGVGLTGATDPNGGLDINVLYDDIIIF